MKCRNCKCSIHRKCTKINKIQYASLTAANGKNPFDCDHCKGTHGQGTVQSTPPTQPSSDQNQNPTTDLSFSQHSSVNDIYNLTPGIDPDSDEHYYNLDNLNGLLDNNHELLVLHLNIDSLVKYVDEVKSLVSNLKIKPHIICITETRLMNKKLNGNQN